jgi:sphinganine-1-phosphate aldolase
VGAGCHVDSCVGGMVLPFLERLCREVPPWDFRVEGVTSMSCDLHKYGYVPKGASVVLHRTPDWAGLQWFVYDNWPSGLYASPAVAGAKSPAAVMTAWAYLNYLGLDGYTSMVAELMETVDRFRTGFEALGLRVVGEPIGTILAFESDTADLFAVGEEMDRRGWYLNRNVEPRGLHMMVSPAHREVVDPLLADLAASIDIAGTASTEEVRYA